MRIYIATRLESASVQNRVRDAFVAAGHEITYDWSVHGSVQHEGEKRIAEVAKLEMEGVVGADAVIVLLPGGRGTHTELGMAIAYGKPTLIVAQPHYGFFADDKRTCAFYYAPGVRRVAVVNYEDDEEIKHIVRQAELLLCYELV